jgi:drug/metabolite transporter (DMT)-like permease
MNLLLYLLVVVIWGTTWIAIKMQLGAVVIPLSIAYRFGLAAVLLFLILAWRGRLARPRGRAAVLVAAQGLCLFCLNFLCFYHASRWIPSGLVAVVFSTAPLWNAFNGRVFLGRAVSRRVLAGAVLGLVGIVALFSPEWGHTGSHTVLGLLLALGGTLCFSAGNLLSGALQARGLLPLQTNAWAMLVGTVILLTGSLAAGVPLTMQWSASYLGALLYLAVPGSVIGFTAYLMLVGRLGAERAAYSTVLFPVVSLNISAWLEGYHWTALAWCGLVLVMLGNVLVFARWRGPTATPALAPQQKG